MDWKTLNEHAEPTGSSLIPGVIPGDYDFFAAYDDRVVNELRLQYPGNMKDAWSLDDRWGEKQARFQFNIDGKAVELFFLEPKFYKCMRLYSDLLRIMSQNPDMRKVLAVKSRRVNLAESIRQAVLQQEAL